MTRLGAANEAFRKEKEPTFLSTVESETKTSLRNQDVATIESPGKVRQWSRRPRGSILAKKARPKHAQSMFRRKSPTGIDDT